MRRAGMSVLLLVASGLLQEPDGRLCAAEADDLTELTLEQLMNIEVTSASRKEQKLSEAAAAVYVITQEDIWRSGATTVADALRMAPGLIVARIDANQWAITSRGFNSHFANKLQVLVDGRSIYNPLFSGVYWDWLNELMPDIDRIEVIRGPGAALWGANAVNGVINIITRHSGQTAGGLISGVAGTEERMLGVVRFGGSIGPAFHYRLFGKHLARDESAGVIGTEDPSHDDWHDTHIGFRADRDLAGGGALMFEGGRNGSRMNQQVTEAALTAPFTRTVDDEIVNRNSYLVGRWTHPVAAGETSLQVYVDTLDRGQRWYHERRSTYDLDFQHRARVGSRQEVVWGLGYRRFEDRLEGSFTVSLEPDHKVDDLVSFFAQDQVSLAGERVHLTFGSKIEHNDYTGFEVQPDLRVIWKAGEHNSVWAAASRAVRTPNRAESGFRVNLAAFPTGGPPALVAIVGDGRLDAEVLRSYEVGWRYRPLARFSLDVAAFSGSYSRIISSRPGTVMTFEPTPAPAHLLITSTLDNVGQVGTRGLEVCANWQPASRWGFVGWYSYLWLNAGPGSTLEGNDPRQQAQVRSYLNLPRGFYFDTTIHFSASLPAQGVDKYTTVDARLAWKVRDDLELSLVGKDLLQSKHAEFFGNFSFMDPTEVQRGFHGRATWRF